MTLDEALARLESISPEAARVVSKELQRGYNGAMVNDLRLAATELRNANENLNEWCYGLRPEIDELADRLSAYANQMVNL